MFTADMARDMSGDGKVMEEGHVYVIFIVVI